MTLQPVGPDNIDEAEWLLRRGFPSRPAGFWQRTLGLLEARRALVLTGPIGVLLRFKGDPVGVLLTIGSRSFAALGGTKVNLSSWYVEDRARFLAPRMLQQATAAGDVLYTDLSPTASVRTLNERLGLMPFRLGSMILPAVTDALRPDSARVIAYEDAGDGTAHSAMLTDHANLGMESVLLETDAGTEPLIFAPTLLRGMGGMRLLFAQSRASIARHRGAIARYLMRRGAWFLEVEANAAERWPGTLFARNRSAVFSKGPCDADRVDHSYSELVFLAQ